MKSARAPRGKQHAVGRSRACAADRSAPRVFACEALEDRRLLSASSSTQVLGALDPSSALSAQALAEPVYAMPLSVSATPLALPTAGPTGFLPFQMRHAYGFDQIVFGGGTIQGDGTGQTIAIVNAFDAPTAANDLLQFSAEFGLATPVIEPDLASFMAPANPGDPPRFVKVSQTGGTVSTGANGNWALETALDIQWAHAFAPGANILLVEADTDDFTDLTSAVAFAKMQSGVSVISMSWGASEFFGETSYDTYFTTPTNHAGVVFAGAAGNSGSPGMYPSFSPNVLSVGGTTLGLDGSGNIVGEQAWSHGGGGLSVYETRPSYQNGYVAQNQRGSPDIAFEADPTTGVPIYDSYNYGTETPWVMIGGTSFATPSWGALVAIADQGRNLAGLPVLDGSTLSSKLYSMPASNFNDITIGSSVGPPPTFPVQNATPGYDLVTGRGTPKANLIVGSLVGTGSISGTVFSDANANGVLDGETGLWGWTIYSDLNNNGAYNPIPASFTNYAASGAAHTIPTLGTATWAQTVAATGSIFDLNVKLNISHNNDSDLVLTLISPLGTRIKLADRVGGSGDNFTNTTFDDSAAVSIARGTAAFTGTYYPAESLSGLYGASITGTWTLEVVDVQASVGGTLNSWSMDIKTGDPSTTSAADGTYALAYLPPGTHHVKEVQQPPGVQTSPIGNVYNIGVTVGSSTTAQNFGNQVATSAAPTGVSLLAVSDTGVSPSDHITKLNNGTAASALQFQVTGTIPNSYVTVYADGNPIGSIVATGATTTVTTDGLAAHTLADGGHLITARQSEPGKAISSPSPSLSITVDTTAPTATIVAVTPDPRSIPVPSIAINFNEAVSGLDLSRFDLTRDVGPDLLTGAQTVTTSNNVTWTLADLTALTTLTGNYELFLLATGSPVMDLAGNLYMDSASTTFTVLPQVLARHLFYNESGTVSPLRYDGNDAGINANDDGAIAPDKVAYLPGAGAATFANMSGYSKGINGVMVDITSAHGSISAADFDFRVGNNNTPSSWDIAPAPASVSVRAGAGVSGSDRVEIIWANGDISRTWLEVILRANATTGLLQHPDLALGEADAFFFGNAIGNTGAGDTATNATVNAIDEGGARNNPAIITDNIPITNLYDFNRDGRVNAIDEGISRNNATNSATVLKYLNIGSPPSAPQGAPLVSPSTSSTESPTTASTASPATATTSGGADGSQSTVASALVAAATQRQIVGHASLPDEWRSFVDDELLDLLAAGRMRYVLRRRR